MVEKLRYILTRQEKWKIVGILILIIIGSFLELMGVAVFMPFISIIVDPEKAIAQSRLLTLLYNMLGVGDAKEFLLFLALGIAAIYIIKNLYLAFMQNAILTFSFRMRMNMACKMLTIYMHEPYTFYLGRNTAELQRSLQTDTNQFMLLVSNMIQSISEVMVVLVVGSYLFYTSKTITVVIIGLLGICVGVFMLVSRKVSVKVGMQNQRYQGQLLQWINQAFGGVKEVKILNREQFFVDNYRDIYGKLIKGAKGNEMLAAVPKYIIETVVIVGMLLAICIKLTFGWSNNIADFVPQLSAFAIAAFRLMPSIGKLNAYINSINYCRPSLNLIYEDLKAIEDCKGEDAYKPDKDANASFKEAINVNNVVYRYPDSDEDVINNVSMNIKKGTTVAFIGSSGAGKTTLADIILGLLVPDKGDICVDKWSIRDNPNKWHSMLGYIPQTIYLTDDSIRRNIAFGVNEEDIDDEAVNRAIEEAQLSDFVKTLPEGVNTFVGDRGVRLSGGQRQRIGIARALYRNPQILVLDEATSALDNETETAVMEAIDNLHGNKTMIIIAHRLTTIRNADVIYEVAQGQVSKKTKAEIGL